MHSRLFSRVTRAVIAALVLLAFGAQLAAAAARPEPGARRSRRGFDLFAETFVIFLVNRVACGVNNIGEICVDPGNSPIGGGGFWPRGTPDQYIFNSGLQLAGIIPANEAFTEWAGDTVGAYFFDARGTQAQGEGITAVYNSLDPADAQAWPSGAVVRDTAIYAPVLIGRNTISQQDLWSRSWDGNPNLLSGRTHPMGMLVETRGLAWNFPAGNEDILYFVFNFYNITASDPAVYANLDPAIRNDIAAIGARYQSQVQQTLGVTIPAAGYTISDTYAAFAMDPDVGDASFNFSTAILPFSLAIAYKSDWLEPGWAFPPDIFGAPFAPAPGFVGVKYLRSPADPATGEEFGLTMWSNTRNAATAFPDPVGVTQLWRYLSGRVSTAAGDNPCSGNASQAVVIARRWCFQDTQPVDTRFYQSSGPFTIAPGQVFTIVVAYVHGAALADYIQIGTDLPPGQPPSGVDIAADPAALRTIDRAAGWASENDVNQDAEIQQGEVTTVPRSVLQKSLVAQEVFDKKFLLPASPEPPTFYLVPGNNQVTVVWQPSVTEDLGDPYYVIGSDPTSALFDPNFRQIDVEGYRIWRGRTAGDLKVIAQFDYDGTFFRDRTGAIDYGDCAPELDIFDDCPETFDYPVSNTGPYHDVDISSPLIQVKEGDRVELANGKVSVVIADSAITNAGYPELTNTGVPFMFIDEGVANSLGYFYAVTAFDVNSVESGPSSLESAKIAQSVTPKALSPTVTEASLSFGLFGDTEDELDPLKPFSIDQAIGIFGGSPPPTSSLAAAFAPLVPQLLPALALEARVDSIMAHAVTEYDCPGNSFGICDVIYLTFTKDGVPTQDSVVVDWPFWSSFDGVTSLTLGLGAVKIPIDPTSAARFGIPDTAASFTAQLEGKFRQYINFSSMEGHEARRIGFGSGSNISPGGSRWFEGENETEPHPGYGIRVGHLPGVDSIWRPLSHMDNNPGTAGVQAYPASVEMQCIGYAIGSLARQADVQITWGAGGQIASVRDTTHHVDVEYKDDPQGSYGFLADGNANGFIDYRDIFYTERTSQIAEEIGFCNHTYSAAAIRPLAAQPTLGPVSFSGAFVPTGTNGTGFGLYINGEVYLFALTGGQPPAAGTVWTLRTYGGGVRASSGAATYTPSGYSYVARDESPVVPGLRVVFSIPTATVLGEVTDSSLARVHTLPDPYYVTNSMEITTNRKVLKFVNLPPQAIIRIYTLGGVLVRVIEHNDPGLGGEASWDLRNRNNQFVASGVYFYHVETANGNQRVGRFTVVNYAQ